MHRSTLFTLLLVLVSALALVACEKEAEGDGDDEAGEATVESVCENMAEASGGEADPDECKETLPQMFKLCPDAKQEVLDCLSKVSKKEDARACTEPCMAAAEDDAGAGGE